MNIKLMRKIEKRLEDLEHKADHLKNQMTNPESYKDAEINIEKEELQNELEDTLNKIKHINAANKSF